MPMNPRLLRPRQTLHPEALDWRNRVVANGGSVSGTTLNAVDRFVKAIVAAGIRDRFYRLNLFAGNSDASLNAVRTPLFRGPSLGGTQFGNALDTNVNFVQGDYSETGASGGLIGNGSSKYLQTGLQTSAWITGGNVRSHLAVYKVTNAAITSSGVMISSRPVSGTLPWELGAGGNAVAYGSFPLPTPTDSFLGVTLQSDTSVIGFRNSVFNDPISGSNAITATVTPFTIFCRNAPSTDTNTYVPGLYSNQRLAAYSIGAGMTQAQVVAFNTAMQAFQTALGRNV